VIAVLDIDSDRLGTFDEVDAEELQGLLELIHAVA
jgi:putative methionine-R-sulfoxide reductase with GAF domain